MDAIELYEIVEEGVQIELLRTYLNDLRAQVGTFHHPSTGNSLLHAAVQCGGVDIVSLVIEYIPLDCIDIFNDEGRTPFHEACTTANFDVVQLLLQNGARAELTDMLGDSALIMLCDGNDCFGTMPTLDLLLSVDLVSANVNTPNLSGDTALMAACENNLCEVVEVLLRRGRADVHVQNRDGETAAVLALLMCNFDVLELLLLYGVDVNESLPNYCEDTLLLGACAHGREEAVHFLLKHGATADQGRASNCETPLVAASRAGNASIVTLLLQHGADADAALYWACACGHVEVVKILLYHGVELETVSPEGDTALQVACRRGDLVTVRLLQQQGATLDTLDSCGRSALMWAIRSGRSDMASFLLDKGCAAHRLCEDFDEDGHMPTTLLHLAAASRDARTLQLLLHHCTSSGWPLATMLRHHDMRGNTALFALLPGGDTAVPDWRLVLLLVASGADLTAKHPQSNLSFWDHVLLRQPSLTPTTPVRQMGCWTEVWRAANWVRRRDLVLCLTRLGVMLPPPSAPASCTRPGAQKSDLLQRAIAREQARRLEELRAAATARREGEGSGCDDSAEMSVLSNYDLRQIVVSYL